MEDYSGFVNIYSIQKTLRFELKPVGKTLEHIEKKGFLKKDKIRAEDYKAVKKIIDKYHRAYIEEVFDSVLHQKKKKDKTRFSTQFIKEIKEFSELYYKTEKNIPDKERLEALSEKLRKMLVGAFKGEFSEEVAEKYKNLFSKELIRNEIEKFCETDEERKQVSNFKSFTTYFTGFHSNRQNIYSDEKNLRLSDIESFTKIFRNFSIT